MKIAIMQPTFIPWAGYFGLIKYVDKFVFLDDVQFERRSWQQRNKIYEKNDFAFITIPIIKKNLRSQKICETRISINKNFKKKQIKRILQNYSRSEYFNNYNYFLNDILLKDFKYLSEMNIYLICEICKIIGIKTDFIKSSDLKTNGNKSEKLINICKKLNSSKYISVEGSKLYIEKDINLFNQNKINVNYFKFDEQKYRTFYKKFIPQLSIIDLLFNCGTNINKILEESIKNNE